MWDAPNMKIILVLRNPIQRAYSHWNMNRATNLDPLPFLEAVRAERVRSRRRLPLQDRDYSYVDRGFYSEQLRRIWRYFPTEQTLVLKTEHLKQRPAETLAAMNALLDRLEGLELAPRDADPHVHGLAFRSPTALPVKFRAGSLRAADPKEPFRHTSTHSMR